MAEGKRDYTKLILGLGLGVLAYFGIIVPILQKLGIKDSPEDEANKQAINNTPGWNPNYYKGKPSPGLNRINTLIQYAKDIKNSFDVFSWTGLIPLNDDESKISATIKQLKNQTELSLLVNSFYALYSRDLLENLTDKLSTSEINPILIFASNLPK